MIVLVHLILTGAVACCRERVKCATMLYHKVSSFEPIDYFLALRDDGRECLYGWQVVLLVSVRMGY
ncbi:MAG: hypothetical protein HYY41_03035 [Chloroflexi bacterium]|nr:hypothetical protein [Chloroflexota bacterium]